jgi:uncharacterized protein
MIDLETLGLMALAIGAGAFVKGVTGAGLPIIAVPVLAIFFGVPKSISVLVVTVLLANAWQVVEYRAARSEVRFLPWMLVAAVPGILVGTWLLAELPERELARVLGVIVICYIVLQLVHPSFSIPSALGRRLAPLAGFISGALQGSTGISAPASVTFLHSLRLTREAYIFSLSSLFMIFSTTQIPALSYAGFLTWQVFLEGLLAIIPAFAMLPVGSFVGRRISREVFDKVVLATLAVIAIKLLFGS